MFLSGSSSTRGIEVAFPRSNANSRRHQHPPSRLSHRIEVGAADKLLSCKPREEASTVLSGGAPENLPAPQRALLGSETMASSPEASKMAAAEAKDGG